MPDLIVSADIDAFMAALNDAAARGELALTALATTTPGTGVATALAVNVGSAGAPVLFNGAGGTPSSIVLTNATGTAAGLTAGTASAVAVGGITGLGTGVGAALAANVGSAGAPVLFNGAGGTPSSMVGTNITGTAAGLTAGTASAVAVGGITGLGADVGNLLAVFSSANLLAALTTSTGTGNAVFSDSPTIDAPTLTGTTTAATVNATNANVTNFLPVSNDGAAIGASGTAFSDLFLASGAVINFNAGNYTLTHSAGVLTANLDLRVTTAGTDTASVVTVGGTQTLTAKTLTSPAINAPTITYTVEPGVDDTAPGERIAGLLAGDTIAQWDLVYLDSTSGRWELADADAVATAGGVLLGLAVTSGTDGNALTVLVRGIVRNDGWTWASAGLKLYASLTPGGITVTRPSATDDAIRPIADTLSDDCIWFAPGQFWEAHV